MFKQIVLAVSMLTLSASFVAAEDDKPKAEGKAKDYKWAYFAALPVYYFVVEIPLHESSHGLAIVLSSNYEITKFQPYPHYDSAQGSFVFGSVSAICINQEKCPDKAGLGKIALAPYIMTPILFVTSDVLLATNVVEPTSVSGRAMYFAGMVVPWWDFTYNTFWATDISDNAKVAEGFGMPRSSVIAKGAIVSIVGAWRLWSGYKRAFPKHPQAKAKESSLLVTPMGGAETVGLSVHMIF